MKHTQTHNIPFFSNFHKYTPSATVAAIIRIDRRTQASAGKMYGSVRDQQQNEVYTIILIQS